MPIGPSSVSIADEVLLEAEMVGIDLAAALEVVAGAVFGIDVDRPDQPLLPERPIGPHGAGQAQETDAGDLHRRRAAQWCGVSASAGRNCASLTTRS